MPVKIALDLPNQLAKMKRLEEQEEARKEKEGYDKFMLAKIKEAKQEFYSKNPALKSKLEYSFQGRAYVKRPGSQVVKPTIVQHLLYPGGLTKTKAAILEAVKKQLPNHADYIHSSIWYNPFKPAIWTRLQTIVNGNSPRPVSIKGCQTLDAIRDRLIAASVAKSATFSQKVTISIDAQHVVIGKNSYTIITNGSKGRTYPLIRIKTQGRQQSLNVNVLKLFLQQK